MVALRPTTRVSLTSNPTSTLTSSSPLHIQKRTARFIARPRRPYTFTQLVVLSDGSTYQHRTTSPQSVYTSLKDSRNNMLWNPTSQKLSSMEVDEAGRLAAFRAKFGRGWDAKAGTSKEVEEESEDLSAYDPGEEGAGGLMDLISSAAGVEEKAAVGEEGMAAKGKGTGKKDQSTVTKGKKK